MENHLINKNTKEITFQSPVDPINYRVITKITQVNILLIEVYVDDIIFGSDDDRLSQKFAKDM